MEMLGDEGAMDVDESITGKDNAPVMQESSCSIIAIDNDNTTAVGSDLDTAATANDNNTDRMHDHDIITFISENPSCLFHTHLDKGLDFVSFWIRDDKELSSIDPESVRSCRKTLESSLQCHDCIFGMCLRFCWYLNVKSANWTPYLTHILHHIIYTHLT
jgi:hypothetical protein